MLIALVGLGLASCKGGFKKGEGGLLYNIHTDKSTPAIKEGDFVSLDLVLKNEGDSVLGSTYDMGRPLPQLMQKSAQKGDITQGLLLLSEGDSATIKLNIDSMFKKGPRPPGVKGKYVIYEIKIQKVIQKGSLTEPVFRGRIDEYFKAQVEGIKKAEPAKIAKFVADKNLKVTKTADGLNYQITKPGSGPNIVAGDTAVVIYTGRLLNGKLFDTSVKEVAMKEKDFDARRPYENFRFPVGAGKVVRGWDEGFLLLNKGAKATFVIPSELGWGEQGAGGGKIPPFSPVVFEVEVVDIVKPNPNAPQVVAPQPPAVR